MDITIIKPIIEACTGEDLITGEDLTDLERGLKVVFAVVDLVTLGAAISATKISEMGLEKSLQAFGKTALIDFAGNTMACGVGALGEAFDWPVPVTIMLSLASGITVSVIGNKMLFKNAEGAVIREKVLDEDDVKKIEIVLDDVPFQTETYKTVYQALGENGITLEEFLDLMRKSADELSPEEAKIIEAIRNSVPMPDANTPLQKVLNPAYVDSYFDGSFVKFNDGKISGCITTVDGAAGMTNPEEIFYGLRMDYVNTPFNPTDDSVVAIKFTSNDVDLSLIHI